MAIDAQAGEAPTPITSVIDADLKGDKAAAVADENAASTPAAKRSASNAHRLGTDCRSGKLTVENPCRGTFRA
jgi:hypothetical protein